MHHTWYDVEQEMRWRMQDSTRFSAAERPGRGMDLPSFAAMIAMLTLLLAVALPALI